MTKDYLLEIGVEELPARFVEMAMSQLKDKFAKQLEENRLEFDEVVVYATPRRLSALVKNLSEFQADIKTVVKGPSAKIAYDENNNPSKALLGFMKSQGVDESNVTIKDDYVYVNVEKAGDSIENIFKQLVPSLIKSINFPKNMRWGGRNLKFARPIRWIVSIYGTEVVEFDLEGLIASNITRGHRFLGSSKIVIDDVSNYEKLLKDNYVILNQNDRLEIIKYESEKLAREVGGEIRPSEDLLTELTYIVEYPTPIMGRIKEEYLSLPNDVITTPMREHLRFIPVYKNKEQLMPYFITIRNGDEQYKDIVVSGNEKVLGARLEDAKFFYKDDLTTPLDELAPKLDGIIFHDKLGNLSQKTNRLEKLSETLGSNLDVAQETIDTVKRAAYLSKADLLTKVVNEFTELQGKMGMIYAKKSGEDELVAKAIFEQYLPRFSGDDLPETTAGSILSIADKMDTIAGLFSIGIIPTGSQDQFAQRRAALGVINIILKNQWDVSLNTLVEDSLYNYINEDNLVFDYDESKSKIKEFFLSRIRVILADQKIRYDIIDATISSNNDNIRDIFLKANILNEWFAEDDRKDYVETFTRIKNMAVKAESNEFTENLFNEYETNLYGAFLEVKDSIDKLRANEIGNDVLEELGRLIAPINNYFDNVMVLVDEEELKANRLGLLKTIDDYIVNIIDFSKIIL